MLFFVLLLCPLGCENEVMAPDPEDEEVSPSEDGLGMLSKDQRIIAYSEDGTTTLLSYDVQGRVTGRVKNGTNAESFAYGGGGSVVYSAGQDTLNLTLDAMGYVSSYKGSVYGYYTSGVQKGFVSSVTRYADLNGKRVPVVVRYVVSGTGLYNSYTVSLGTEVKTYTVLYGDAPNYSDTFNPVLGNYGLTFLGRAPLRLPVRIDCSDKTYRTFSYTFYPTGQVETWDERYCLSDGTVFFERFSGADWSADGVLYTGGAQIFQSLKKSVLSVLEDNVSTALSYNSDGFLSLILQSRNGVVDRSEVVYVDQNTILMNGQTGLLNESGCLVRLGGCEYEYNEAGYLISKKIQDESLIMEEVYSYNSDNCVSKVLKRWKFSGGGAWLRCDSVRYEYTGASGYSIKNNTPCIDVARGDFWNPFLGKVSPSFPVREVNEDYVIDLYYKLNSYNYPEKITFLGASGLGQSYVVRISWTVESASLP